MKTSLMVPLLVIIAWTAFSQARVEFYNHVPNDVVTHIYGPLSSDPGFSQVGNGSDDTPPGQRNWRGFPLVGAGGAEGPFGGATTLAQLLGAFGANQPESSLLPAFPTTTFQTGAAAGFVYGAATTFNNIPFFDSSERATIQMVAWDNTSGLYPTWAQAAPAWQEGLIAAGKSRPINVPGTSPLGPDPTLTGLESFNLYYIPEPSTFALTGLGAALGFWRIRQSHSRHRRGGAVPAGLDSLGAGNPWSTVIANIRKTP
jgi:hypothetical protein